MKVSSSTVLVLLLTPPKRAIAFSTLLPVHVNNIPQNRANVSFQRRYAGGESSSAVTPSSPTLDDEEDASTIKTLSNNNGQTITLIGTAHLSKRSNRQVERIIQEIQPETVAIELDPARLVRIGIASIDALRKAKGGHFAHIETAEDIPLPTSRSASSSWTQPLVDAFLQGSAWIGRQVLTRTYRTAEAQLDASGGGEFLAAIEAAQTYEGCQALVLADRSSVTTIQRALALAWESGDMWGLYQRLDAANRDEMKELEVKVAKRVLGKVPSGDDDDALYTEEERKQVMVAMMEQLKEDAQFRDRLFARLEKEAPEFTQAFLNERDYIMGECIVRALRREGVSNLVGVVGLAHVAGIEKHLQATFRNEMLPLVAQLDKKR